MIQDELREIDPQDVEQLFHDLSRCRLTPDTLDRFLSGWTAARRRLDEALERRRLSVIRFTEDRHSVERFEQFLTGVYLPTLRAEQGLREKLLKSAPVPGIEEALDRIRLDAALSCEANLPLLLEEQRLWARFIRLTGAQTVQLSGRDVPLRHLRPIYEGPNRRLREYAWRLETRRRLQDGPAIEALWRQLLAVRTQLASNAGFSSYRAYRPRQLLGPGAALPDSFGDAVEEVVAPVVTRLQERLRQALGLRTIRPWDLHADPLRRPPLQPFTEVQDLIQRAGAILRRVHPDLGASLEAMSRAGLLDLESRAHKAPGAWCLYLPRARQTIICLDAVGVHDDVQRLFREVGLARALCEMGGAPWTRERANRLQVVALATELLPLPYLSGGLYDEAGARRALLRSLERCLLRWTAAAMADAFERWAYDHPDAAADGAACGRTWAWLWLRFLPGVDWTELEEELEAGWQGRSALFLDPFVSQLMAPAQIAAVHLWDGARRNPSAYQVALSSPATAGNIPPCDEDALRGAVNLLVDVMEEADLP